MELSVPAPLRALVAKHGAHVIQALAAFIKQIVLNHSPDHPRCGLRPQSELFTVQPVFKGVHLLFNDIGHLAQATHKQGGGLDDGRTNIAISKHTHDLAHRSLQGLPTCRVGRQYIVHAFDGA